MLKNNPFNPHNPLFEYSSAQPKIDAGSTPFRCCTNGGLMLYE
jgi:hypothetical protein